MSLSDRDRKLMMAIVPVLVIAAFWFLVLSPKRQEAATASVALTEQQERLETARAASRSAAGAEQGFEVSYAQLVRLGKAIPSGVDMPSLLIQLDAAAAGTGIHFTKIATGERTGAATAAPAAAPATPPAGDSPEGTPAAAAGGAPAESAPGAATESANTAQQTANGAAEQSGVNPADVQTSTTPGDGGGLPVGGGAAPAAGDPAATGTAPAGLETVPLQLEFVGNFFNLADFFHRVKRFVRVANDDVLVSGRLLTVEGVRWASDSEIFPRIRAEMTATVYLSPKAQGVSAGATPQGPAPTTPVTGAPTPATTAPAPPVVAPTATATP